jgi:hypothetical protein
MDIYIHSPIRLHVVVLNYLSTGTTLPLKDEEENIILILWIGFSWFIRGTTGGRL